MEGETTGRVLRAVLPQRFSTGELLWRAQLFPSVKTTDDRGKNNGFARFPGIAPRFIVLSPCLGKAVKLTRYYTEI